MKIIDMRPCAHCGTLIGLPWLVVDDMTFCGWEHYRLWKNQQFVGDDDHAPPEVDRGGFTDDAPQTTEQL